MSEFLIRAATESDIDAVLEIENISFSDPWSRIAFEANLRNGSVFLVVCDGQRVIGYEILALIPPESELYNIAVLPEFRGTGAAKQLFSESEMLALEKGVSTVYLEVRESNLRARNFYKKFGFSEMGVRKNYYHTPTENAVIMSKNI